MTLILCTRVFRADIESDHYLLVTSIQLKLQKKHKKKQGRRFNVKLLPEDSTKTDFLGTFTKCLDTRYVEEGWIPLHKRQSRKDCGTCRGITLLSVPEKVLSLIPHSRLQGN